MYEWVVYGMYLDVLEWLLVLFMFYFDYVLVNLYLFDYVFLLCCDDVCWFFEDFCEW